MKKLFFKLAKLYTVTVGLLILQVTQPLCAAIAINSAELNDSIAENLMKVQEFQFIRHEAEKLGVRVWLLGGTAAGYAHYVKWDLLRKKGDTRYQSDSFDYDYTNIYHSTQDSDIVIDGTNKQAEILEAAVRNQFPHLQGTKSAWEIRLLKDSRDDKEALLNNPNFYNQHTDSNSTGMIEITKPINNENIVRDLKDWESKDPIFLHDVTEGKLHYYFSNKHKSTLRYKEGKNPPIFSAVRYLIKAFQFELEMRPEDLENIKKVVNEFDPKKIQGDKNYILGWLERNGAKLLQNAVNIEYAWDTIEKIGLRKKLIALQNNPDKEYSLAWLMSRAPLKSYSLGKKGKTAKEIFEKNNWNKELIVSHETKDFLAYESITRAHTGDLNVFVSRNYMTAESAAFGEGFYTKVGLVGAKGTGFTIRSHLDPNARLGSDFDLVGDIIIIKNKRALHVIPESLNFDPIKYFSFITKNGTLDRSNLAIYKKLERRVFTKINSLPKEKIDEITKIIMDYLADPNAKSEPVERWIQMSVSTSAQSAMELLKLIYKKIEPQENLEWGNLFIKILELPHWKKLYNNETKSFIQILSESHAVNLKVTKQLLQIPAFLSQFDPNKLEKLISEHPQLLGVIWGTSHFEKSLENDHFRLAVENIMKQSIFFKNDPSKGFLPESIITLLENKINNPDFNHESLFANRTRALWGELFFDWQHQGNNKFNIANYPDWFFYNLFKSKPIMDFLKRPEYQDFVSQLYELSNHHWLVALGFSEMPAMKSFWNDASFANKITEKYFENLVRDPILLKINATSKIIKDNSEKLLSILKRCSDKSSDCSFTAEAILENKDVQIIIGKEKLYPFLINYLQQHDYQKYVLQKNGWQEEVNKIEFEKNLELGRKALQYKDKQNIKDWFSVATESEIKVNPEAEEITWKLFLFDRGISNNSEFYRTMQLLENYPSWVSKPEFEQIIESIVINIDYTERYHLQQLFTKSPWANLPRANVYKEALRRYNSAIKREKFLRQSLNRNMLNCVQAFKGLFK